MHHGVTEDAQHLLQPEKPHLKYTEDKQENSQKELSGLSGTVYIPRTYDYLSRCNENSYGRRNQEAGSSHIPLTDN